MSFLAPWMIAAAAGLTVPPLVLLYFLKLRRQEMPISSTLLWKKAVEDLHVNSPFQRLRKSLLLILQLLILLLAAVALGKPMLERALKHESTLVLMIDQSASMGVVEESGDTRLELARREARRVVDGMEDDARAMVIAFCDRATVVSSFDTDREALKRKIDSIEQTNSTSSLREAVALAEAYAQNLIIAGSEGGSDVAPAGTAPPATAIIFSDGRIADSDDVSLQRIQAGNVELVSTGRRDDNVAIVAMDAKRNYERPDVLEVFATVRNFGPEPVQCDATLRIRDQQGMLSVLDTQEIVLAPGRAPSAESDDGAESASEPADSDTAAAGLKQGPATPPPGSVAAVAFDDFTYAGGGVIEVSLTADDALKTDNKAWTVVRPPRSVRVLLVTEGLYQLEKAIRVLPVEVSVMTPEEYENAPEEDLAVSGRSLFDTVVFDRHATDRLPQGDYLFMGAAPLIEGVSMGKASQNAYIVNWDETHPVLRHVTVELINAAVQYPLTVPSDAEALMEGETSPILAYLSREGSDFLILSFPLVTVDEATGRLQWNTDWPFKGRGHFVVFLYNAIQFLSASVTTSGENSVDPGTPVRVPLAGRAREAVIIRPDGTTEEVPSAGANFVHYGRTRQAGVYNIRGAQEGNETFAVNLFSAAESDITPVDAFSIGAAQVAGVGHQAQVNRPAWHWFLLALLGVLLIEWIVYNKRVFV